eukprot:10850852-Karenia_brevis.AAC.1
MMKSQYNPTPFTRKDQHSRYSNFPDTANHTARYLSQVQWGLPHTFDFTFADPILPTTATRPITIDDVLWAVHKLKRHKTPGPDGTPVGFFKEMDPETLTKIAELLNKWWTNPDSILDSFNQAKVVLIFKNKGDTDDC